MVSEDKNLTRYFDNFYHSCKEALLSNIHLMDGIFFKALEQNRKIIEQNREILNQCQNVKLQLSGIYERLEELKNVLFEGSHQKVQPETSTDVEFIGIFPRNSDGNDHRRAEDGTLCSTSEPMQVEDNKPDENIQQAQSNDVSAEASDEEESTYALPQWLVKDEEICELMKNQEKLEKVFKLLFGNKWAENESHIQRPIEITAKLFADLKEVGSYLQCFCVDPEEIENNEDMKMKLVKLRLFMSEMDAEFKKINETHLNDATSMNQDENIADTTTDKQEHENCIAIEENAVTVSPNKECDSNDSAHSRKKKRTRTRKRKMANNEQEGKCADGEKAKLIILKHRKKKRIVCKKEKREARVRRTKSNVTSSSSELRSSEIPLYTGLRSGRVLDICKNNIGKRRTMAERGRSPKSLDKSRPIRKTKKIKPQIVPNLTLSELRRKSSLRSSRQRNSVVPSSQTGISTGRTDRFYCDKCGRVFNWSVDLCQHYLKQHSAANRKAYKCKNCPKSFEFQQELHRHEKEKHMTVKLYGCERCHQSFGSERILNMHIQRKHL